MILAMLDSAREQLGRVSKRNVAIAFVGAVGLTMALTDAEASNPALELLKDSIGEFNAAQCLRMVAGKAICNFLGGATSVDGFASASNLPTEDPCADAEKAHNALNDAGVLQQCIALTELVVAKTRTYVQPELEFRL